MAKKSRKQPSGIRPPRKLSRERKKISPFCRRGFAISFCHAILSETLKKRFDMTRQLTSSLEDYLEAIAELIAVDGHAHTKEIAAKLNVKMPSVTGALRQLSDMGCITYSAHYPVQLTPQGRIVAERIMHRHQVLKSFFSGILGLPAEKASRTACQIEHLVDADTIRRFTLFSDAISRRRDAGNIQTFLTEAIGYLADPETADMTVMSEVPAGAAVEVVKFGRNLGDRLPVKPLPGDRIVVQGLSLDQSLIKFSRGDEDGELPVAIAENIWVRPLST